MNDWFKEDWGEKLSSYGNLSEKSKNKIRKLFEDFPETRKDYYEMIMSKCNEEFNTVTFVDYNENEESKDIIFMKDENGNLWDMPVHPIRYALEEVAGGNNYGKVLKEQWKERMNKQTL